MRPIELCGFHFFNSVRFSVRFWVISTVSVRFRFGFSFDHQTATNVAIIYILRTIITCHIVQTIHDYVEQDSGQELKNRPVRGLKVSPSVRIFSLLLYDVTDGRRIQCWFVLRIVEFDVWAKTTKFRVTWRSRVAWHTWYYVWNRWSMSWSIIWYH